MQTLFFSFHTGYAAHRHFATRRVRTMPPRTTCHTAPRCLPLFPTPARAPAYPPPPRRTHTLPLPSLLPGGSHAPAACAHCRRLPRSTGAFVTRWLLPRPHAAHAFYNTRFPVYAATYAPGGCAFSTVPPALCRLTFPRAPATTLPYAVMPPFTVHCVIPVPFPRFAACLRGRGAATHYLCCLCALPACLRRCRALPLPCLAGCRVPAATTCV